MQLPRNRWLVRCVRCPKQPETEVGRWCSTTHPERCCFFSWIWGSQEAISELVSSLLFHEPLNLFSMRSHFWNKEICQRCSQNYVVRSSNKHGKKMCPTVLSETGRPKWPRVVVYTRFFLEPLFVIRFQVKHFLSFSAEQKGSRLTLKRKPNPPSETLTAAIKPKVRRIWCPGFKNPCWKVGLVLTGWTRIKR